jgi:hypothetical protein
MSEKLSFKDLKIGDNVNFDLILCKDETINKSMLVLEKNETHVLLHDIDGKWLCSEKFFNNNTLNVSVLYED